jgi:hypothetical protein
MAFIQILLAAPDQCFARRRRNMNGYVPNEEISRPRAGRVGGREAVVPQALCRKRWTSGRPGSGASLLSLLNWSPDLLPAV